MSAAVAAAPAEPDAAMEADAPKKRGPPVVIIDSGNTNVAGGISGRALASRVKTFQDGSNVWVREKTEATDAPEAVEARREALRAKTVIEDDCELDADKAKEKALGGVSEELLDTTAREIQCFRLAAFDVSIDELEVKEWLRPDADPSDYFNYGLGEDTWRGYRDQQLILRRSLQERRASMAQAAARERHQEMLQQGGGVPPMPQMLAPMGQGPRGMPPPWQQGPPRGFPGMPMGGFPPRGFPPQNMPFPPRGFPPRGFPPGGFPGGPPAAFGMPPPGAPAPPDPSRRRERSRSRERSRRSGRRRRD